MAGWLNYHIYFDLQSERSDVWGVFSTPETLVGNTMAKLGPQTNAYLSVFYYNAPTMKFLAPLATEYSPLQTYDSLPMPLEDGKTTVFFVDPDRQSFFEQAQKYYPQASFTEYRAPNGVIVLYQIILDPPNIAAAQGITAGYYHNADFSGQPFLVANEKTVDVDWRDGKPSQFPFWAKWQGALYAEQYGLYRLTLHSPSPAALYLDDAQISLDDDGKGAQTAEVELAKGVHSLAITTEAAEGHFELEWQPPNGERATIPASNLFLPPVSNNGLLGRYFANGDWQEPPAFTQIDPWIRFYYHNQPLPRPYTVEWSGRIYIPETGAYAFLLEARDEAVLFIDGSEVTSQNMEQTLELTEGFHPLRLRYADRTGYTHVSLYWTPPKADREVIPQEALFLP